MGSKPQTISSHVHFADRTLAGVPGLLSDLQELVGHRDTADVNLLIGAQETVFYMHKLILWTRCKRYRHVGPEFWMANPVKKMTIKYPGFDVEIFRDVLSYIYTGKIILQDLSVFNILAVAQELGIPDLQLSCEEHIAATLSPSNACAFYTAARQMEQEQLQQDVIDGRTSFSARCAAYIEENAQGVVRSEGWLELPQESITKLLDSDTFALEEEDVWRAVLAWAKHHAGIPSDKNPTQWNEHEKKLAVQALSGVINHVKLLLIDSKVFAEEVEPTGAVPMELSLERYRYAAVPDKFDVSQDWRKRPRVSLKLFQGTHILSGNNVKHQRLLNAWFGETKQAWRLIYRASQDGSTAESFHKHCDGHSPTFVIIKGATGNICGGFSDVPWTSNAPPMGRFLASQKAFLFTLVNNQGVSPCKFDVALPHYATLHHPSHGPIFGAGADLSIANHCMAGMECYSNLPHSYHGDAASSAILMGDYNFNVLDYEVFTPVS